MTCKGVRLGGVTAIVCSRGARRHRCAFCDGAGEFQCDFKIESRRSGTCDAYICRNHARLIGPNRHYCPTHSRLDDQSAAA